MLRDSEVRIDTGRAGDGGTFVRVLHLPTGRVRTKDRLGAESHAAVVSRLRAELEAELVAAGFGAVRRAGQAVTKKLQGLANRPLQPAALPAVAKPSLATPRLSA